MNLYHETLKVLEKKGKTTSDIVWIGSADGKAYLPNKYFQEFADFEYDAGYGGNEVPTDLVIVGKNWWLERGEYDGSEWWEFKTLPKLTRGYKIPIKNLKQSENLSK